MSGDRVEIKPEIYKGQLCFGIFNLKSERIGYMPRTLVPSLKQGQIVESYISLVNLHAVPWKRYEVTVVNQGSIARPLTGRTTLYASAFRLFLGGDDFFRR
jgi:hypothetical protein